MNLRAIYLNTLLLMLTCWCGGTAYAQDRLIYGITTYGNQPPVYLTTYNCTTMQVDTVYAFTNLTRFDFDASNVYSGLGLDAYNGRVFWLKGHIPTRVMMFDLNTQQLTSSNPIYPDARGQMEYDIYGNRLLIKTSDSHFLLAYHPDSGTLDTVGAIRKPDGVTVMGSEGAYDPYTGHYLYGHGAHTLNAWDPDTLALFNTNTGQMIRQLPLPVQGSHVFRLSGIHFNLKTGRFYGSGVGNIYLIDTAALSFTPSATITDSVTRVNTWSVYDSENGQYLSGYDLDSQSHLKRRIAYFDVQTGQKVFDSFFSAQGFNRYADVLSVPRLQVAGGVLRAPYGKSYQWYRNDTLLPGTTQQTCTPSLPGIYHALVDFLNDNSLKTEGYVVAALTVGEPGPRDGIRVYPNPAHDLLSVSCPRIEDGTFTFSLFNALGQLVKAVPGLSAGKTELSMAGLNAGVYYYRLTSTNGWHWNGQLVIR